MDIRTTYTTIYTVPTQYTSPSPYHSVSISVVSAYFDLSLLLLTALSAAHFAHTTINLNSYCRELHTHAVQSVQSRVENTIQNTSNRLPNLLVLELESFILIVLFSQFQLLTNERRAPAPNTNRKHTVNFSGDQSAEHYSPRALFTVHIDYGYGWLCVCASAYHRQLSARTEISTEYCCWSILWNARAHQDHLWPSEILTKRHYFIKNVAFCI